MAIVAPCNGIWLTSQGKSADAVADGVSPAKTQSQKMAVSPRNNPMQGARARSLAHRLMLRAIAG
jgi:hypothetical protein